MPADKPLAEDEEVALAAADADVPAPLQVERHVDEVVRRGGPGFVAADVIEIDVVLDLSQPAAIASQKIANRIQRDL